MWLTACTGRWNHPGQQHQSKSAAATRRTRFVGVEFLPRAVVGRVSKVYVIQSKEQAVCRRFYSHRQGKEPLGACRT